MEALIAQYEKVREEYQAKVMARMSREQYLEYSEILFSTHSCAIEGNSFTVDDTRALKEMGLGMVPKGRKLLECIEMSDHFRAFEYIVNNLGRPFDESLLKETNRLVMEHTMSYYSADAVAGEYTKEDMAAGDTIFGDHEKLIARVPELMNSTEKALHGDTHPMVIAARFHGYYEYLHPFRDGNGRTGRLLCNYILMRKGHPQLTIMLDERREYIAALKKIRTEGTDEYLTSFFFERAIAHMQEALEQKHKNGLPKFFLF